MSRDAYVFDAVRTPRGHGGKTGALADVRPIELVTGLLHALAARGVTPAAVDDVVLGCVTQVADQGANLARSAVLFAGWPDRVPGMTLTRFCTSGLDAIGSAAARVIAGFDDLIIAGGVESMSRVPMLADRGAWFADPEVAARTGFIHMGLSADLIAQLDGRRREELDAWALRSHTRAAAAWDAGAFARSVVPVVRGEDTLLARDERVRPGLTIGQLAAKQPAMIGVPGDEVVRARYPEIETVTRLHSSGAAPAIVDGAALVVIGTREAGRAMGLRPRAKILGYGVAAAEPVIMLTATSPALRKAAARGGVEVDALDLVEINESFSAPVLRTIDALGLDAERVNVHGGAIAMGHPLGASGAILTGTLVDALEERGVQLGACTLCAGAGLGAAAVFERVEPSAR